MARCWGFGLLALTLQQTVHVSARSVALHLRATPESSSPTSSEVEANEEALPLLEVASATCQPQLNTSDEDLERLYKWNCLRVQQACTDLASFVESYDDDIKQFWLDRMDKATKLCKAAEDSPLLLAAEMALEAWGDVLMRGRECCNVPGPPYCTSERRSKLARLTVLLVAVLAVLLVTLSPYLCSRSVYAPVLCCIPGLGTKPQEVTEPVAVAVATTAAEAEEASCPDCGTRYPAEANFCLQCGSKRIQVTTPAASPPPLATVPPLALDEALIRQLEGIWMNSTLRKLPDAEVWAHQAAQCFAGLQAAFGFQSDSVRNQFEHLISLWRSHCAVCADRRSRETRRESDLEEHLLRCGFEELHNDLLAGFTAWRSGWQTVDTERHSTSDGGRNGWWSQRRSSASASITAESLAALEELSAYLLVWGEAGNLRFMPELLYFLVDIVLVADDQGPSMAKRGGRSGDFLVATVRPIYQVLFEEHYTKVGIASPGGGDKKVLRDGFDKFLPADSSNYDDWNELFCDHNRLAKALSLKSGERFQAVPPGRRYSSLPSIDWAASLAGVKTHREVHSWWGAFAATHRLVFLHLLLYCSSVFWVTSRNFHDDSKGDDVLLGGGSPLVCFAAVGLLVPLHGYCWRLSRWFTLGRTLRSFAVDVKGFAKFIRVAGLGLAVSFQALLWSLPICTFGLVRWLDAVGDEDFRRISPILSLQGALWLHLFLCCFGSLHILVFPAQIGDELWEATRSSLLQRAGRWLFWIAVLAVKVLAGLRGIAAINTADSELDISRPGRESLHDLQNFAFGPNWDKDMIQWLALWGTGLVCYMADTQFWYCLGCTLLAALLAMSQREWHLTAVTFEDALAAVPQRCAERLLREMPPGHRNSLPWREDAPPVSAQQRRWFSQWFPDLWDRVIEFMRYEDKLDDFMAGQLKFSSEASEQVTWEHLHENLKQRSTFTPPLILEASGCGQRCLGRTMGILPDANWPRNDEVRWRLSAFARCLASKDLPRPFSTPYLPGLTVMIPHYGESILLCKDELCASDRGEEVPLIAWLEKRYHDDFQAFTVRAMAADRSWPRAGAKWNEYGAEHWQRLCGWASMRSQTLWRTVVGMMLYLPALECHRQIDRPRFKQSKLLWDASEVFTCMVAMQMYAFFKEHQLEHTERMFQKYPRSLQVAFIDVEDAGPDAAEDAVHKSQERRYYSCLIDANCSFQGSNRRRPRLRIELPGFPILGDGKGDNQNHALPFSRGSIIQTIDANQGAYFEQMLLLPCVLGEFRKKDGLGGLEPRIVGFPEHITSDIGSVGDFAAGAETAFGTVLQRAYAFLGARMHYGHPDMMNKEFMMQQGGVSKATKTVNLSEDIFAGMDFTLRGNGRNIVHREYFYVAKGRDLGFNTVLTFFSKLAAGTGEQILTRQMLRLGHIMDLPEFLSFYYAHAGFYLTQFLLSKCIPLLVFIWLVVVLDDPEDNFPAMDPDVNKATGASIIARMLVTQYSWLLMLFMAAQTAPLFLEMWWERSIIAACSRILKQMVTLAPLHFIFQAKIIGSYIINETTSGGAKYVPTGRGLPTERRSFIGCRGGLYNDYADLALYDGAQLLAAVMVVVLAGGLCVEEAMFWWLIAVGLTIVSWLFAPFIFNPYQFVLKHFLSDLKDWREFFFAQRGSHWIRWYSDSQLRAGNGVRSSPIDAVLWALYLSSLYTILNQKVHVLNVIFAGERSIDWSTAQVMLPPIFLSLLACAGLPPLLRYAGVLDLGDEVTPAQAAALVVFCDCLEAACFMLTLVSVHWWKTVAVGVLFKYSLLSLALLVCECAFCMKGNGPGGDFGRWLRSWLKLWMHGHRMARDIIVSSLIFWVLAIGVLFDRLRACCCDEGCSLHNILIYRDPGGVHSAATVRVRRARSSSDSFEVGSFFAPPASSTISAPLSASSPPAVTTRGGRDSAPTNMMR